MRVAFKEWAIIEDALGGGDQIVIFRKGGIAEGRGGFQVEHPEFLLFPTLFHQQRESVLASAQTRFDLLAPTFPPPDTLRLSFFAKVADWRRLDSLDAALQLRGQHIWRDEVVAGRFDWGKDRAIHALAVRVWRLPQPVELPMRLEYGGCKSWVELERDIPTSGATPVLEDARFAVKLRRFQTALGLTPGQTAATIK